MSLEGRKWLQTIRITYSKYFVYRVNFLLEFVGPMLIFYFIRHSVWSAIYRGRTDAVLRGYTFEEMIAYQGWVLIVMLLAQTYKGSELALDIRYGRISAFLLYPFDFWKFHFARFLVHFSLQSVTALATLLLLAWWGILQIPALGTLALLWGLCGLISVFWFVVQFFTGILAFWLEETWVFRVGLMLITQLVSGAFIPMEFFPESIRQLLHMTPFPYLTYYPISICMGAQNVSGMVALTLLAWVLVAAFSARFLWKRGLRLYSAAGM